MADNKQHDTRTTRRPDCVTEIRMGNSVLVVSGYFKKDTTHSRTGGVHGAAATRATRREPGHGKAAMREHDVEAEVYIIDSINALSYSFEILIYNARLIQMFLLQRKLSSWGKSRYFCPYSICYKHGIFSGRNHHG